MHQEDRHMVGAQRDLPDSASHRVAHAIRDRDVWKAQREAVGPRQPIGPGVALGHRRESPQQGAAPRMELRRRVEIDGVAPGAGLDEDVGREPVRRQFGKTAHRFADKVLRTRARAQVVAGMQHDAHARGAPGAQLIPREAIRLSREARGNRDLGSQPTCRESPEEVTIGRRDVVDTNQDCGL